ncbi:MAG TPA: hypothetical protein VF593_11375 [Chthoniobacteraceae bacterium]|jgi:hypothetical protein
MVRRVSQSNAAAGFTLLEVLVAGAVSSAVGVAIFAFMNAGMFLSAKNLALNLTSNQMRYSLDRVEQVLQQGDTSPVLITTTGAAAGSGPAAGVKLDRYLGGPYVISAPGSGGLPETTTVLNLTRSTHALASPPIPRNGDVVRIDTAGSSLRPTVAGCVAGTTNAGLQRQPLTVTLTAPLGTAVPFSTSFVMTAKLVCSVAFIVMPNGSKRELRYYDRFDTVTNLNDPSRYVVISDQIALQGSDITPFSLTQLSGKSFVAFSLRVRGGNYDRRLLGKQSDEFNTYSRVEALVRPRVNP